MEKYLWWVPKSGTSALWFDNCTKIGPLFLHLCDIHTCHPLNVDGEFLNQEGWNYELRQNFLLSYVLDHIRPNFGSVYY